MISAEVTLSWYSSTGSRVLGKSNRKNVDAPSAAAHAR
jgi:hypothetical protein